MITTVNSNSDSIYNLAGAQVKGGGMFIQDEAVSFFSESLELD
jgi:hypothetical protein